MHIFVRRNALTRQFVSFVNHRTWSQNGMALLYFHWIRNFSEPDFTPKRTTLNSSKKISLSYLFSSLIILSIITHLSYLFSHIRCVTWTLKEFAGTIVLFHYNRSRNVQFIACFLAFKFLYKNFVCFLRAK